MNILLHTIALEPARWMPQKVSRPLAELLPTIAGAGFYKLEVFEPHLSLLPDEAAMARLFQEHHLVPAVLDSSLELASSADADHSFQQSADELLARVDRFGFAKVCLSPGRSPDPGQATATMERSASRLRFLAGERPEVEFLLGTRSGLLADDPALGAALVERVSAPNVGLVWEPVTLDRRAIWSQWLSQQPYVRHFHLRNQTADGRFCRLGAGVIPWEEILDSSRYEKDVTLELVPSGICALEQFDLSTSVQEAVNEFETIVNLET